MKKLKISVFFLIFLVISVLDAGNPKESMASINRFPQNSDFFEDYQIQTQTKAILDPAINGILYPVIGFPAMVTPDEPCFSVIFRHDHFSPNLYYSVKVKLVRRKKKRGKRREKRGKGKWIATQSSDCSQ